MATLTKAQLSARVLQYLGLLAAGQSAEAEDDDLVQEAIDACHEELRKEKLADFLTSAIPTWAQGPLRDFVAAEVAPAFGMGSAAEKEAKQAAARRRLAKQVARMKPPLPAVAEYF